MVGPSYWFDIRIFLAVVAALLTVVAFYNPYVAVLGLILLGALYYYGRERYKFQQQVLNDYLDCMVRSIGETAADALERLPVGIVVLDAAGRVHWSNREFENWTKGRLQRREPLRQMWPGFPAESFWGQDGRGRWAAEGRQYQVLYRPLGHADDQQMMVFYFTDITADATEREECQGRLPVLAYIQVDNMDDVLHGLPEGQRSALMVEVGKQLNQWLATLGGVIRKHSKDTYLAVLSRRALQEAMDGNFDILDRTRGLEIGNRIPVTLSIGAAADEATVAQLGDRAQAGLDLALGRGGDQAAVFADGKYQFFGGKAKVAGKSTRVKARVVAHAIRDLMQESAGVLVMGHGGEDFDSLGAAIGVAKMARQLGKPVRIITSQSGSAMQRLVDLSGDYEEGATAALFCSPEAALAELTPESLLVVVDTHRPQMAAAPELLQRNERVVVIDHHRRGEAFLANPLLVYLEPSASSTCELVTELLMYFDDKINLTKLEATALYAGIVVDTKNFAVQTGVRTFDAAAFLRRAGADPGMVRHLFRHDLAMMKDRAEIIRTAELLPGGAAVAVTPPGMVQAQIAAAQAADALLRGEGVRASFVVFPMENGVGVSARSQEDINVQIMMEELGGGGHQTVAGAQLPGMRVDEVRRRIIELCTRYIEESDLE